MGWALSAETPTPPICARGVMQTDSLRPRVTPVSHLIQALTRSILGRSVL